MGLVATQKKKYLNPSQVIVQNNKSLQMRVINWLALNVWDNTYHQAQLKMRVAEIAMKTNVGKIVMRFKTLTGCAYKGQKNSITNLPHPLVMLKSFQVKNPQRYTSLQIKSLMKKIFIHSLSVSKGILIKLCNILTEEML